MRHLSCSVKRVSLKRATTSALCCLSIFFACSIAQAQSGRRVAKRPPPVSTTPSPETEQKPAPPVTKAEKSQLTLYVCTNDRDPLQNIPYYLADTIRNVFVQRISQASSIDVTTGPEMHRSEAVKRAKAAEHGYVVLLQLDLDSFAMQRSGNIGGADLSKVFIRYIVFTPVTGKVKTEGRVYQDQYRAGRGGIPIPSPRRNNPLYSDYLLKEAARDAANRVLAEFRIYQPRGPALNGK